MFAVKGLSECME